jgi:hypothetical protein
VTWIVVNIAAASHAAAVETLADFGARVIAKMR